MAAGGGQAGPAALAAAGPAGPAAPAAASGEAYAPSVRAHSETVLRGFYDFHLEAGTGPLVNPFPLDRSRRGGRAHAHHNPMEPLPPRAQRACTGRRCRPGSRAASRMRSSTRSSRRCRSHRDRALVAFYVSTGARASELLSATRGGVDPGRQLITVVRKGTRELQQLPASTDAFVWLRLYQVEMDGLIPAGQRAAVVVDAAAPGPAADLSRGAPHVRAGRRGGGHRRDAALAAAHRGLPDGRGSGAAADRRAVRPRSCAADHHADLPDARARRT